MLLHCRHAAVTGVSVAVDGACLGTMATQAREQQDEQAAPTVRAASAVTRPKLPPTSVCSRPLMPVVEPLRAQFGRAPTRTGTQ